MLLLHFCIYPISELKLSDCAKWNLKFHNLWHPSWNELFAQRAHSKSQALVVTEPTCLHQSISRRANKRGGWVTFILCTSFLYRFSSILIELEFCRIISVKAFFLDFPQGLITDPKSEWKRRNHWCWSQYRSIRSLKVMATREMESQSEWVLIAGGQVVWRK